MRTIQTKIWTETENGRSVGFLASHNRILAVKLKKALALILSDF